MAMSRPKRVSCAGVLAVGAAMVAMSTSCAPAPQKTAAYCALMPDAVGLYSGNPVTQMGYPIGQVTSIDTAGDHVRVEFSLTERRQLPADVKAVIRSPSILADRSLEVVGNYDGGPELSPTSCIGLDRSFTPKSLSEVIGSTDTFIKEVSSRGSTNIADTVHGVAQLVHDTGSGVNELLTATSALLDSPDQQISDIASILRNTATVSTALEEMRQPLKEIVEALPATTPDLATALVEGTTPMTGPVGYGTIGPLSELVATLETELGEETQITLDSISVALRKVSPHANELATLFNAAPWWINAAANHINSADFGIFNIAYRPPLFRVPTHDGLALCGFMNATAPGSCADVHGQPYAVDVALLQYVLQQASQK